MVVFVQYCIFKNWSKKNKQTGKEDQIFSLQLNRGRLRLVPGDCSVIDRCVTPQRPVCPSQWRSEFWDTEVNTKRRQCVSDAASGCLSFHWKALSPFSFVRVPFFVYLSCVDAACSDTCCGFWKKKKEFALIVAVDIFIFTFKHKLKKGTSSVASSSFLSSFMNMMAETQ